MGLSKINNELGKYRWTICTLVFFATTINYLDRAVISLLKPYLEKEFTWTETDYSNIVIAFQVAYAVGMIFVGRFIDKVGTKIGYALSLLIWSISAIAHSFAKSTLGFIIARTSLGISEAGNFPAANRTIAEWFPIKERALATGIYNSGANVGAILAPLVVPWMAVNWGWQWAFIITGAIGLIWLFFWFVIYEIPAKNRKLTKEEYDYIHSDKEEVQSTTTSENNSNDKVSWLKLLKYKQTWSFFWGKAITDPVWWFWLFWLPAFLDAQYNLVDLQVTLPLAIVYTMASIGSIYGGWLPMKMISIGWSAERARRTSMFIYALFPIPVLFAQHLGAYNMWCAVIIIGIAAAAHQAWSANLFTTVSDMFPKKTISSVTGIGGMAGALGGLLISKVAGNLFDSYKIKGIQESFKIAREQGLTEIVNKLQNLGLNEINTIELRKLKDSILIKINTLDLGAGFEQLKTLQKEIVMKEMTKAYLIMFVICGSAYLLAWIIMKILIPKSKKVDI